MRPAYPTEASALEVRRGFYRRNHERDRARTVRRRARWRCRP